VAVLPYHENQLIGKIIENFKYHYIEELSGVMEVLIKQFIKNNREFFVGIEQILPVPLHPRRLAERGFNQAEIIARILASELSLSVVTILQRSLFTEQQARLSKVERHKNVEGAFVASTSSSGRILLVDDVFTTGATMQECAKVLLESGAKEVIGFTLARG
jgi:ComF family protein